MAALRPAPLPHLSYGVYGPPCSDVGDTDQTAAEARVQLGSGVCNSEGER
jgi:hypothetical protein